MEEEEKEEGEENEERLIIDLVADAADKKVNWVTTQVTRSENAIADTPLHFASRNLDPTPLRWDRLSEKHHQKHHISNKQIVSILLDAVDSTEAPSDTVDVLDARRITPLHTAVKVAIQWALKWQSGWEGESCVVFSFLH